MVSYVYFLFKNFIYLMINRKHTICLQKCKNLAQFLRIEMKWLSILHLLRHLILKQLFNN